MSPQLVEFSENDPGCLSGVVVPFMLVVAGLYGRSRRARRSQEPVEHVVRGAATDHPFERLPSLRQSLVPLSEAAEQRRPGVAADASTS